MIRFSLVAVFLILQVNFAIILGAEPQLSLVNVVFRHGDRTPNDWDTYTNDPYADYTYYPIGRGGLTNEGKRREYQLGKVLKERYGDFLGALYDPTILEARSTDVDRAKMSLQLVLSALFPPEPIQDWNDQLPWQPIPVVYTPIANDVVLLPEYCPQYITESNRVKNTTEVQEKVATFAETMAALTELTGQTVDDTFDLYGFYQMFDAQRAANVTLPEWACKFYPYGDIMRGAILEYEIRSYNDYLKRINGGTVLRKITDNAISYKNGTLVKGRKLFLYSAHDTNVASLLITLGLYDALVPAYASAVIIELLQLEEEYFIKVLHYTGIPSKVVTRQIPGCEELCPIDKFLTLLAPVIATDADLLCP